MPRNRIRATPRAKAAIAAVLAAATAAGGYYSTRSGFPPEVELAVITLVMPWEGRSLKAYLDTLAKPPVWTICDGDTQNVKPGMVETPEGCNKRLSRRMMTEFYPKMKACVSNYDKTPISWRAMILSLAWNIGTGAACRSTAVKLAKVGKYRESCEAATAFNKAGGRMLIGLVNRREMGDATRIGEAELCVSGLSNG